MKHLKIVSGLYWSITLYLKTAKVKIWGGICLVYSPLSIGPDAISFEAVSLSTKARSFMFYVDIALKNKHIDKKKL